MTSPSMGRLQIRRIVLSALRPLTRPSIRNVESCETQFKNSGAGRQAKARAKMIPHRLMVLAGRV